METREIAGRHAVERLREGFNLEEVAWECSALRSTPLRLNEEDHVIGVAKMGSRTASDFAVDQRLILRSTAERAAAFIAQKRTLEDRELFLHVFGHDLRSPLNAIVLGTRAIQRHGSLSPQAAQNAVRVLSAAERMVRLIADMTDFTQTRVTGTLTVKREVVDMGELAEQIARETQAKSERQLVIQRVGDATGEWDRGRVLRVIANLVNNALAYGDPAAPVTLGVEGEDGWVVPRVHNEGAPIPAELRPHTFEAFKRGTMGAEGRGSTFVVRLPRAAERGAGPTLH
jgi:signal transduction histidine kinase